MYKCNFIRLVGIKACYKMKVIWFPASVQKSLKMAALAWWQRWRLGFTVTEEQNKNSKSLLVEERRLWIANVCERWKTMENWRLKKLKVWRRSRLRNVQVVCKFKNISHNLVKKVGGVGLLQTIGRIRSSHHRVVYSSGSSASYWWYIVFLQQISYFLCV